MAIARGVLERRGLDAGAIEKLLSAVRTLWGMHAAKSYNIT